MGPIVGALAGKVPICFPTRTTSQILGKHHFHTKGLCVLPFASRLCRAAAKAEGGWLTVVLSHGHVARFKITPVRNMFRLGRISRVTHIYFIVICLAFSVDQDCAQG